MLQYTLCSSPAKQQHYRLQSCMGRKDCSDSKSSMWKLESTSTAVVPSPALLAAGHGWGQAAAVVLRHNARAKRWQCKNRTGKHRWGICWTSGFVFCKLNNTQMHKWVGVGGSPPPRTHRAVREPLFGAVPLPRSLSQLVLSPASPKRLLRSMKCAFFSLFTVSGFWETVHLHCHLAGRSVTLRASSTVRSSHRRERAEPCHARHACHPTPGSPHPIPAHRRGCESHHNSLLAYPPLRAGARSLCTVKSYKRCFTDEELYSGWGRGVPVARLQLMLILTASEN